MQTISATAIEEKLSELENQYANEFEYEASFTRLQIIWQEIKELRRTLACQIILGKEEVRNDFCV
jgi:hypothetical protein